MPEESPRAARLTQLRQTYAESVAERAGSVIRPMLSKRSGDLTANETLLLAEIEELAATVAKARAEIAAIGADDITESHIPSATDELDAIVAHTADATNGILECCETIDAMLPRLAAADAAQMQDVVTRIYEACCFQDITGQRITKVVSTLQTIEAKVAQMTGLFGGRTDNAASGPHGTRAPEAGSLLNGPQLPANAMDQSDIDALLGSFD